MSKRNLSIVGVILLFAGIISVVYWTLYRHQNFDSGNVIDAVPVNSALIIRVHDTGDIFKTLSSKINYRADLESFKSFSSLFDVINYADSSAFFRGGAGKKILNSGGYFAFSKEGKESVEWSAHFGVDNMSHQGTLRSWLEQRSVDRRNYTGFTIYDVVPDDSLSLRLFVTLQDGVLTVSGSSLLVETSIRQQQSSHSLEGNEEFAKLEKTTSSRADGNVFVNFSRLPEFSKPFLSSDGRKFSSFLGNMADWGVVDFDIKDDGVMLNGFLSARENSAYVSLFKGVNARRSSLGQVLPSDIRLFLGYNFSNGGRLVRNFKQYILGLEGYDRYETLNDRFEKEMGGAFIDTFFDFLEGEMALAYSNYNASDPQQGRFLIFRTKGQVASLPVLKRMQEYFDVGSSVVSHYRVDESTSFPIYQGFSDELNELVWGQLFPDVPMQYFSFFRNYLVFADSQKSLESFLYDNVLNRNLDSHAYYSSFMENFSYEDNLFLFAEIPHLYSYIDQFLNQEKFHPTTEQNKVLFDFYAAGLQISNSSGLNYTTVFANHAPHRDKEPRTIWQSRIDSLAAMKPALVDNHYTREKEIMVQDKAHNLYLINNMGRVLWKRPLEGPVLSEIYQIDYYRNNKYQYLFNTSERLYLLDRNGNYVAKYPFTLPARASTGLSVFDYDNNRDYRVFLPLDDRKVYLFDKSGARISGWNIPQTEGVVSQPVQFFRTSGKDFIVFSDRYRNYIMDRRGNHRVTPDKGFVRNSRSPFYLEYPDSERTALVTSTVEGSMARILIPSGKTAVREKTRVENDEHFFLLLYEGNPKYVFVTPDNIKIYNSKLELKVDSEFEVPVRPIADVYRLSSTDHKIGLVSADESKIYLYNADGSVYKGFPLKGTSRFSIGFLKSSAYRFNLITGGENNYIYNYRVE